MRKLTKFKGLTIFILVGLAIGFLSGSVRMDSLEKTATRNFPWGRASGEEFMLKIEAESDWEKREEMAKELAYKVGPEVAIELLNKSNIPKAGRGHLLAHRIGEAAFEIYGDDAFAFCQNDMFSGCSHGLMSIAISEVGFEGIKKMITKCRDWGTFKFNMCHHASGHAFLALADYDVFPALENCDRLAEPGSMPHFHCINGLFMEEAHGEHDGMIPPLHPQLSTSNLMSPCDQVKEYHKKACYLNIAGWWLQVFGFDIEKTAGMCEEAPEKYQIDCVDNVARLISTLTNNELDGIKRDCQFLRKEDWKQYCLVFIAQSVSSQGDEVLPYKLCREVKDDAIKQDCYIKLAAGLQERYKVDSDKYKQLCSNFEPQFKAICDQDFWLDD